ncbi:hypothetical protein EGW08_006114 [Elysia chlorotica]|uniref:Uncharacterized protein n=1 Tax=Elysia chlorotica TaxID=188477 RepID=A0A3S1BKU4_ELYCH|nr:hypothetical protein EGW08_006114 [Elysia chlorotica]
MALIHATKSARGEIQDFLMSGNYYITEEIARELSVINNALEHLSLDGTFLSTSADWQQKPGNFSPNQITGHMSGAMCTINQVGNKLAELKGRLGTRVVQEKQENELRELHQWAVSSLKNAQKELEPYTFDAADRIKQFGDTIGVTDRYTGYRQNLNRGSRDPFKMQTSWMDPSGQLGLMNNLTRLRSVSKLSKCMLRKLDIEHETHVLHSSGYRTIDSLYPKSSTSLDGGAPPGSAVMGEVKSLNARNACAQYQRMEQQASQSAAPRQPYKELSVQEQAGINTSFPGKTEYMQRFKAPDTDLPTPDFKINPSPNFAIYGRPMQRACYIPSFTEYQTRYEWPDAEKIVKLPWLRN